MGALDRLRAAVATVIGFIWRVLTLPVRLVVRAARRIKTLLGPVFEAGSRGLRLLWRVLTFPFRIPIRVWRSIRGLLVASPATKALTLGAILLASIAGAGFFYAATSGTEVSASSAPVISALFEWMTNGWGYVIAAVVFGRGTIWGIRSARIRRAAQETGYSPETITQAADEIRTTQGTNRAIIFGDDTVEKAKAHIRSAFEGEADTLSLEEGVTDPFDEALTPAVRPIDDQPEAETVIQVPDRPDESDDAGDDGPAASASERFKLWRMDLATSLQTSALIWRLLVPAAIVFVLELIVVQFWVQVWLYPSMLAAALLVGLGVYKTDQWRRKRRLRRLRGDRTGETWEEISVLVKTVETPEVTLHIGFLAGRRYASKDREDLVETLATRALERSNGYHPSPAIEERYAWCVDRYILNFAGWRENFEKPGIYDELVSEVLDSEEGIVPRDVLAGRVTEHDRRYIWQGLRFVGMGYGPDLVAECYEELVPAALVEREMTLEAPDGGRDIVGVRARVEALPPDVAKLRANFSQRFPMQSLETRYDLPDATPEETTQRYTIPS
ncbi:hypothetical protein HWV23_03410 [Natronomonas halophila]|uniref:hypothetical protein n=1 Tax=Natronomonas halophila TaxID=2747817 RepID=UPI0015B3B8D4|nr:hypothetical protein [Natronomonas halophila]QLD84799.1 hypothetical protein HWV23_03410 [Natronomonas halophila]